MLAALKKAALRPADRYTVWLVLLLSALGVVAVYSAVAFLAETKSGGDQELFLLRHTFRLALALGAMGVLSVVDYHKLARLSKAGLVLSLGLLVAVQIVGVVSGGAARWLRVGALGFQPSDLANITLLLYLSVLLVRKQAYVKSFSRAFLPALVWIGATVGLIGMQNLSSAAVLMVVCLVVCFVARVSVLHLSALGGLGLALATLMLWFSPARAARVEAYTGVKIFPHTQSEQVFDVQDEGYQARQARIAIALGGWLGVGPGKSVQRDFLPAPYNDFIYAIVAEEYGLLGALLLLAAFIALLYRGYLRIARYAPDPLGLLLGVAFTTFLVLYGLIHIGVSCGLLPVTGLPLPFVSYGGTALVAMGAMTGILLNVSRQSP